MSPDEFLAQIIAADRAAPTASPAVRDRIRGNIALRLAAEATREPEATRPGPAPSGVIVPFVLALAVGVGLALGGETGGSVWLQSTPTIPPEMVESIEPPQREEPRQAQHLEPATHDPQGQAVGHSAEVRPRPRNTRRRTRVAVDAVDELRLVDDMRVALARGEFMRVRTLARAHSQSFERGHFGEEVEAILLRARCREGRASVAEVESFQRSRPASMHLDGIRHDCEDIITTTGGAGN